MSHENLDFPPHDVVHWRGSDIHLLPRISWTPHVHTGLHWIDFSILAIYAAGMLLFAGHYARRKQTNDDYFTGGGKMPPFLIGISMFATLFSTITYLSTPGEILNHGPVAASIPLLAIPAYYYIVAYWIAPRYMLHRATSAYALLETQLGIRARITGAILFILLRLVWMSTLIFFASKAMLVMLGWDASWLPAISIATGSIALAYASMGGLRAVVITDTLQFFLLLFGALVVLAVVTFETGGLAWLPTRWNPSWDEQPVFSLDPTVRVTATGTILHAILWWVCTAGGDQTAIQRFMATPDTASARRSFLVNSLAGAAVSSLLVLVGFALLAYYQLSEAHLPQGKTIAANADELFPYFISHHLPVGLSGIVVCGLFAAAMSSIDSGINSITAVVSTDLVERFRRRPLADPARVRLARSLAITIGFVVIAISSFAIDPIPGNFLEQAKRSFGLLVTPMFLLFLFALFVPFGTQGGAIAAALSGFGTAILVAYWNLITGLTPLSFQWIFPFSLIAGFAVGCLWSWCLPRPSPNA